MKTKLMYVLLITALVLVIIPSVASASSSSRTLPDDCVSPDSIFTVTISASDYGAIAEVSETLDNGWTYMGSSLQDSQVSVYGNTVKFYLFGESSLTYTVQAPSTEGASCTISGIISDQWKNEDTVDGDSEVSVCINGGNDPYAVRDLPSQCVSPDSVFEVSVCVFNYGTIAEVTETLCDGWTYTGSSLQDSQVVVSGNTVKFYLFGETGLTYTVQAPSTEECCTISGSFEDQQKNQYPIGGDTGDVCVCNGNSMQAYRTFESNCVDSNAEFTVTVSASNYGTFGEVAETLCDGWTYTGSSLQDSQVDVSGNTVKFYLFGETSLTYTVQAPSTEGECCVISGILRDQDLDSIDVEGDSQVCVCPPGNPTASRTLPDCVDPNTEFTITVSASDYGTIGEVTETLCDGWTYTGSSLQNSQVDVSGNTVKFYLFGETDFTYTVQAPSTVGECCSISGNLRDQYLNSVDVEGDSQICVGIDWCTIYDTNGIPGIQKMEAVNAINDYLIHHTINKEAAVTVINCYLL